MEILQKEMEVYNSVSGREAVYTSIAGRLAHLPQASQLRRGYIYIYIWL